jgi:hypothetical protein
MIFEFVIIIIKPFLTINTYNELLILSGTVFHVLNYIVKVQSY